eukprot:TRINITY_DN19459_c0_g1_i1.p1 TRINITY_DN19459_c0_g1~~TRINITY_DN19459_c0_g1_i1.p1  ORF type:complete len:442 (+),score=180.75 TRINITY_DN19459_c0_g1_i1:86-1327(+)
MRAATAAVTRASVRRALPGARRPASSAAASPPPCTALTEEEDALRDMVASFCKTEVEPKSGQMDRDAKMCPDLIRKCFEQGLMGIEIPSEYGGAGMSFTGSIVAIEEVAKVDGSVAVMVDVQNTLVNTAIRRWGREEQREQYLPRLASDTVGSFCLSEAGSGSDAFALKTKAEKKGGKYVLNGSKMWITNSGEAGIFLVMANCDFSKGHKGITCFIVDRSNPGLRVGKKEDKLGIRASSTCEVLLEDCEVDEGDILWEEGLGYKMAILALNEGRIGIGAQMLGIAQGAFDVAVKYCFERKQFGQVIGRFQGMQHQIAQAATNIQCARLLVYNAARKKERGEDFVMDAAMAKLVASQVAGQVTSQAIDWMGGVGISKDFPVERLYRDCKVGTIYEGTSNIQLQTIAKLLEPRYA